MSREIAIGCNNRSYRIHPSANRKRRRYVLLWASRCDPSGCDTCFQSTTTQPVERTSQPPATNRSTHIITAGMKSPNAIIGLNSPKQRSTTGSERLAAARGEYNASQRTDAPTDRRTIGVRVFCRSGRPGRVCKWDVFDSWSRMR